MRTYSRAAFLEARAAWTDGDFGDEWKPYRAIAAERGFIYPPEGSKHDDRDVDSPSQRAIIWAAIDENPKELERIIRRSDSWHRVVDQIFGLEARLADDANEREHDAEWAKDQEPSSREAVGTIAGMFERFANSLGYVRKDEP